MRFKKNLQEKYALLLADNNSNSSSNNNNNNNNNTACFIYLTFEFMLHR
jgi:hypothetical protein